MLRSLVCTHCGLSYKTTAPNKKYCSSACQVIASRQNEWDKTKTIPLNRFRVLVHMAKNRSTAKALPFDLDAEYVLSIYNEQGSLCAISNQEFDFSKPDTPGQVRWNAPSLDRINPKLGYIKGNIRIVCYQVNVAISSYGLDQFLDLCRFCTEGAPSC